MVKHTRYLSIKMVGQSADIKSWLLQKEDLAALAENAMALPLTPLFITPAEMIDVAESELLSQRVSAVAGALPPGENVIAVADDERDALHELDHWLAVLRSADPGSKPLALQDILLPASFAIASYRASMLPLLGDANESALQGATAALARLPLAFQSKDKMLKLHDTQVAAISVASLSYLAPAAQPETP